MHYPPQKVNSVISTKKLLNWLQYTEDYNRQMEYVDKPDDMTNSYSVSRRT